MGTWMLSACVAFKDEAKILPQTFYTWTKFADTIVLQDTGSSDGSKRVIDNLIGALEPSFIGCSVWSDDGSWKKTELIGQPLTFITSTRLWEDNFSVHFNDVLEQAEDWALMLGADDYLHGYKRPFNTCLDLVDKGFEEETPGIKVHIFEKREGLWQSCYKVIRLYKPKLGWYMTQNCNHLHIPSYKNAQRRPILEPYIFCIRHLRPSMRKSSNLRRDKMMWQRFCEGTPLTKGEFDNYQALINIMNNTGDLDEEGFRME